MDVNAMEGVACRLPLQTRAARGRGPGVRRPRACQARQPDAARLRLEIATVIRKEAARVQARCDAAEEHGGEEFRLGPSPIVA
jgi:hypothetical protein